MKKEEHLPIWVLGGPGGPLGTLGVIRGSLVPQRASVGDTIFTQLGGPNVLRSNEILIVLLFERFWRELDRQKCRCVV